MSREWEHISDTKPRARQPHRCYLCGRQINVGEVYLSRVGANWGEFICMAMHIACSEQTRNWDQEDWWNHDVNEFRQLIDGQPVRG